MKQKVETLQADLSRRQESYIRRERAFNMRIDELEDEVGSLKVRVRTSSTSHITRVNRIRMHNLLRLPKRCALRTAGSMFSSVCFVRVTYSYPDLHLRGQHVDGPQGAFNDLLDKPWSQVSVYPPPPPVHSARTSLNGVEMLVIT